MSYRPGKLLILAIEGEMLIIADSAKNHNRKEGFPCNTWFCRIIRPVNSTVCKFSPLIVIILGIE